MVIVGILVIGVIVVLAALLPLGMFLRCRQIDAVRRQKLRESYDAATADVSAGQQSWEWRFDSYQNAPSFDEMVWKVWRPVESFYDGRTGVKR
jgi:hypothetical protein